MNLTIIGAFSSACVTQQLSLELAPVLDKAFGILVKHSLVSGYYLSDDFTDDPVYG